MSEFSDFIVYLDESGSPTVTNIEKDFPIFVLACVLVEKTIYSEHIVPALQNFKFKYFGHDQIILHEREIRRQSGEFSFLQASKKLRGEFLSEMSEIVDCCDFSIATAVIDKKKLAEKYPDPYSPYEISLLMTMEHLALMLRDKNQLGKTIHVIAEARGKKEDAELELVFRRIADGDSRMRSNQNHIIKQLNWHILFSDKKSNSAGLQLADLVARPIGLQILRPEQKNRTYEIIEKKVQWWIKTFPKTSKRATGKSQ